ncbi:MAG: NAD(P)/FAD-dependent oxidoreductase, partial [Flavisolibacter sp.]
DELMEFAFETYYEMGKAMNSKFIFEKTIIDFFPSPQMRNAFIERLTENDTYLHSFPDQNHFNQYFNHDFGCGEIKPAYIVNVQLLLACWRKELLERKMILDEKFDIKELTTAEDHVSFHNITAQKIIFCEGSAGIENPWFKLLPYAPNKGEALIIECEGLTNQHIFKKGLMLAPLPVQNLYWIGSNYQWEFLDDQPSETFYNHAVHVLNGWLKKPYRVLFHKAAVRPATLERRPFVGLHPHAQQVGILNGMGTKGTSLAPFFAQQLTQHLVYNLPISPEADIQRFNRILSK